MRRGWSLRDGISINLTTILARTKMGTRDEYSRGDKWLFASCWTFIWSTSWLY
jgi:hypothetical protein